MQFPPGLLDRFQPVRLLASGGFGSVWLAQQRALDRPVAVKTLHAELAGTNDETSRFHDEARLTASISHPGVVTLLDFGVDNDQPWMAFEFVEGQSLRTWVEKGPARWQDVVEVGRQVALALEEARRCGVIHRDIKPDNILQCEPGRYKVADFGIAKWAGASVRTQDGVIMGTPAYISPMQVRGLIPAHQSDLYALGVTLFELLTGRLPFTDENPLLLLERHLTSPPPRVRTLAPEVPPALERIVAQLLAKDRDARYQTAAELAHDLAQLRPEATDPAATVPGGLPVRPGRAGVREPASPVAASRWTRGLGVLAVALLAAMVARPRISVGPGPVETPTASSSAPVGTQPPAASDSQVSQLLTEARRLHVESERLRLQAPREQEDLSLAKEKFEAGLVATRKVLEDYASLLRRAARRSGPPDDALLAIERTGFAIGDCSHRMVILSSVGVVWGIEARNFPAFRAALLRVRAALDERTADPNARLTATSLRRQFEAMSARVPWRGADLIATSSLAAAAELSDRIARDGKGHSVHALIEHVTLLDRAAQIWWRLRRKDDEAWTTASRASRGPEREARQQQLALVPAAVEMDPFDTSTPDLVPACLRLLHSAVHLAEDPLADRAVRERAVRAASLLVLRRLSALPAEPYVDETNRVGIPRLLAMAAALDVEVDERALRAAQNAATR